MANRRLQQAQAIGVWDGNALELWLCLFFEHRRWRHFDNGPRVKTRHSSTNSVRRYDGAWLTCQARSARSSSRTWPSAEPAPSSRSFDQEARIAKRITPAAELGVDHLHAFA